jgi:tRNA-modifying protein YgfZ
MNGSAWSMPRIKSMAIQTLPELDAQYRQLREGAGYLARTDRALLAVAGADAAEYLQGQLSNEIEALAPGEGCYATLLDRKGHMQADLRVLRIAPDEIWLTLMEVARAATLAHLEMYKVGREVELTDRSGDLATLSVIGPQATSLTGADGLTDEHSHRDLALDSTRCRAIATDVGVDLICDGSDAPQLAEVLATAGAAPVSEEAAEIIRVESGRPRYGAEMGPQTIPAEAGIVERAVNFEKGCYIGQETVARLHYKGKPNRHLRGLRLSAPATAGDPLLLGERQVGEIGTACISPALGPIALAIVRREASPGDVLSVGEGGTSGEVVELPFQGELA